MVPDGQVGATHQAWDLIMLLHGDTGNPSGPVRRGRLHARPLTLLGFYPPRAVTMFMMVVIWGPLRVA